MTDLKIWIIESKHKNPNDFYVKVDGSDNYTGFWVANTESIASANELMMEACNDLDLGTAEIIHTSTVTELSDAVQNEVKEKINSLASQLKGKEDVQLAAWISSNGGLW